MFYRIRLQARAPERNIYRDYLISVDRDLLGDLIVSTWRGRIGSPRGAIRRELAEDDLHAMRLVRQHIKDRASAPRRIGVPYKVVEAPSPALLGLEAARLLPWPTGDS